MTVRVTLVTPAVNAELRGAVFGADGPLDEAGRRAAERSAAALPPDAARYAGTSARCRATAAALGLTAGPSVPLPAPADWDVGRWRGRGLDELAATEPDGVAAWLSDPAAVPHGGESLLGLCDRVGAWLDGLPPGRAVAVTEAAVVRAAVVYALGLPPQAFWRLDAAPLAATRLTGRAGRWNLRLGGVIGS